MTTREAPEVRAADAAGVGHVQRVLSPEQVGLDLPIAGPGPRILAYAIDYLIILVVQFAFMFLALMALIALGTGDEGGAIQEFFRSWRDELDEIEKQRAAPEVLQAFMAFVIGIVMVFQLLAEWVYFIASEMLSGGGSLGKKALKIRVVRSGGLPLTFRTSLTRNVLRIVDILPGQYLVGLTSMVLSKETRRLGDFAADTIVVRLDRPTAAPEIEPLQPGEHGLIGLDHAMRARLTEADLKLARATLRRVSEIDEEAAQQALRRAVEVVRKKIGYETEVPPSQYGLFLRTVIESGRGR